MRISVIKISFLLLSIVFLSCNDKPKTEETILKGKTTVYTDESLLPIVEDEVLVFQSRYDATIDIISKSENEIVKGFRSYKNGIYILSRPLNNQEINFFQSKKITPKTTKFANDAIALIVNAKTKDTTVTIENLIAIMKGEKSNVKGLVFDNLNSSTLRYFMNLSKVNVLPENNVYSFTNSNEVVKFVAQNPGMIGVVGVNWLMQPKPELVQWTDQVVTLSVNNLGSNQFFAPTQNNIAEGTYPLKREVFIINCQGFSGLGMGFASFLSGDIGQRIILKSGLVPAVMPGRKILIRNQILNKDSLK